jgi:hypothetical protein
MSTLRQSAQRRGRREQRSLATCSGSHRMGCAIAVRALAAYWRDGGATRGTCAVGGTGQWGVVYGGLRARHTTMVDGEGLCGTVSRDWATRARTRTRHAYACCIKRRESGLFVLQKTLDQKEEKIELVLACFKALSSAQKESQSNRVETPSLLCYLVVVRCVANPWGSWYENGRFLLHSFSNTASKRGPTQRSIAPQ